MIILPAIDIKDGNCVRLIKGDFDTVHKVAENPLETARSFERDGAEWLHMVDLDGAKDAVPKNRPVFLEIAARTRLKVEVGGGIRDLETVEYYFSHGIARVILGSVAVKSRRLFGLLSGSMVNGLQSESMPVMVWSRLMAGWGKVRSTILILRARWPMSA